MCVHTLAHIHTHPTSHMHECAFFLSGYALITGSVLGSGILVIVNEI